MRTFDRNISSQYYERLLLSQRKEPVKQEMQEKTADLQQDKLEFIKNPVVAEFLGLAPNTDFTECELEGSCYGQFKYSCLGLSLQALHSS